MKPITFDCKETLTLTPYDAARQILDVTNWPDFHGYGPIPGIKTAESECRGSLAPEFESRIWINQRTSKKSRNGSPTIGCGCTCTSFQRRSRAW